MVLLLFISDVAAAAGMNRYKTPEDILQQVYNYNNNNRHKTPQTKVEEILVTEASPQLNNKVLQNLVGEDAKRATQQRIDNVTKDIQSQEKRTVLAAKEIAKEVQHQVQKISQSCDSTTQSKQQVSETIIDPKCMSDVPKLAESLKRDAQVQWGIEKEASSIDLLQELLGSPIEHRNDQVFYYNLSLRNGGFVKLCGRVDGIIINDDKKTKTIVEMKERRNRLFDSVPLYEQVQLQVYLRACQAEQIVHAQCFNKEIRHTHHTIDEDLWARVKIGLDTFAALYQKRFTKEE